MEPTRRDIQELTTAIRRFGLTVAQTNDKLDELIDLLKEQQEDE